MIAINVDAGEYRLLCIDGFCNPHPTWQTVVAIADGKDDGSIQPIQTIVLEPCYKQMSYLGTLWAVIKGERGDTLCKAK
jgi:hypothetical protein